VIARRIHFYDDVYDHDALLETLLTVDFNDIDFRYFVIASPVQAPSCPTKRNLSPSCLSSLCDLSIFEMTKFLRKDENECVLSFKQKENSLSSQNENLKFKVMIKRNGLNLISYLVSFLISFSLLQ
jgi:hypothetical protein